MSVRIIEVCCNPQLPIEITRAMHGKWSFNMSKHSIGDIIGNPGGAQVKLTRKAIDSDSSDGRLPKCGDWWIGSPIGNSPIPGHIEGFTGDVLLDLEPRNIPENP
jgi:hypothetical protein